MQFAVRLLLLISFTAHALLGCCLLHGNCWHAPHANISDSCASECGHHSEHTSDHQPHIGTHRQEIDSNCFVPRSAKLPLPVDQCQDTNCSFGLALAPLYKYTLHYDLLALFSASPVFRFTPHVKKPGVGLSLEPNSISNGHRAFFQIWLI